MAELTALLAEIGRWALSGVWLPLLMWTVVAVGVLASLRLARPVHPLVAYPLHLALVLGLPLVMVARPLVRALALPAPPVPTPIGSILLPAAVASTEAGTSGPSALALVSGLALLAVAVVALAGLLRLCVAAWRLRRYCHELAPDEALQAALDAECEKLGLGRPVRAARAASATVPFTFGWWRPVVVVPDGMPDRPGTLSLALGHELMHVRRHDFAVNLLTQAVAAAFLWHPLVPELRQRLELLREVACDAELLAHRPRERSAYANLLCSVALSPTPPLALAAGTDTSSLHQRLSAMTRPPKSPTEMTTLRRSARCLALGLSLLLVFAVAGSPDAAAQTDTTRTAQKDGDAYVMVDEPPVLIGGLEGLMEQLRYPELARNAGIQGTIFVQFIVDEQGIPTEVEVVNAKTNAAEGDGGLSKEALRVVRQARFEPGRHDGDTVKVRFTLPIRFELPAESSDG